jgi:hypothetical protein
MSVPRWLEQLQWSRVWMVADLMVDRKPIPSMRGCYVFTEDGGALRPNHVLYIGKAEDLRGRVGRYLLDYRQPRRKRRRAALLSLSTGTILETIGRSCDGPCMAEICSSSRQTYAISSGRIAPIAGRRNMSCGGTDKRWILACWLD